MKTWMIVGATFVLGSLLLALTVTQLQDPTSLAGRTVLGAIIALTMTPLMQRIADIKGIAQWRWWAAIAAIVLGAEVLRAIRPLVT